MGMQISVGAGLELWCLTIISTLNPKITSFLLTRENFRGTKLTVADNCPADSSLLLLGSANHHGSFDGQNREVSAASYENCVAPAIEPHHSRGDGSQAASQCEVVKQLVSAGENRLALRERPGLRHTKAGHPGSQRAV